uniref:Uncharacterized protein n=1 Tax=Utricularia reniformis TaxID=192314 RepID=A0A1Y0B421_9LAMI|nr:hypothetical protein AEK19_MT1964 [Utricularia reniformis]ART32127.1 hypothetical protein AEK19_MT1964 [Utricularia reniformis]
MRIYTIGCVKFGVFLPFQRSTDVNSLLVNYKGYRILSLSLAEKKAQTPTRMRH